MRLPHPPASRHTSTLLWLVMATGLAAAQTTGYHQAADGRWRPLPAMVDASGGGSTFTVDPGQLRAGRTTFVLNAESGVVLDDAQPPLLMGVKLDGRPLTLAPKTDLDGLPSLPETLVVALRDGENRLPASALSLRVVARIGPLLRLPERFDNTVELRAADASPARNTLVASRRFRRLGPVSADPTLLVDSCYQGYKDTSVLLDGQLMTPGETTVGVTWASQEAPGDHWVVIA